ncbi:thioredoxin-dependent thiol peroxidase [Methanoplanus limicola]|uniref:thioredoxin-dependent peroxiredoxin n=1 Tax=Methanoplanus limicola DSM 2279 TaxID=937775 RepID=H1YYA5_9EURY|nr:thioredoxin-dependent thiol peroxidase [Methanoplanus limicola]EHQ34200.1 alkyl hydroperoxide reductase/ Thiol specific antioxidant/ Mal allergen [Methanoplanus limicola DSM 2279]
MADLKDGDNAPEFCLKDMKEMEVCLPVFKGKWVVLYFYPKDNTPGCSMEAETFTAMEDEFRSLNTVIVGISPDSCESHRKFAEKHSLSILLLSDPGHEVLEKYGVWKQKKMFGNSFLGVERSTFLIDPEGKIRNIWRKVRVKGHAEAVLEKVKLISG